MTEQQIIAKAKTSPALEWKSDKEGKFAYPKRFEGKVPLKIKTTMLVMPDMPLLAKDDTVCDEGKEYYCWVNSYGAVSAICPNGEQLGLKPHEFIVTEYH